MAKYLCDAQKKASVSQSRSLVIYEIGPGTGSLADSILEYVSKYEPVLFKSMEYNMVEISETLHKSQIKRFENSPYFSKMRFYNHSFFDHPLREERKCFVLAFEVLASWLLVHDQVARFYPLYKYRTIWLMIESCTSLMEVSRKSRWL